MKKLKTGAWPGSNSGYEIFFTCNNEVCIQSSQWGSWTGQTECGQYWRNGQEKIADNKAVHINAVVELSRSLCHIDIKREQSCSECYPLLPSLLCLSLLKGSLCKTPPLCILTHPFMAELCSLVNPAFKRAENWRLSPLAASAPSWRPPMWGFKALHRASKQFDLMWWEEKGDGEEVEGERGRLWRKEK